MTSIGFLGAGQMATALARGWVSAGLLDAGRGRASDVSPEARDRFTQETGIAAGADNRAVLAECDLVVLAVKPQTMPALLKEVQGAVQPRHLFVSIAAGITLVQLSAGLGTGRIVRVMPNTPCLVAASAAGYSAGPAATAQDVALVDRLLHAVGEAYPLPEHLLDAVTGLSGSGPAFAYVVIEALADGGVKMGLPREAAQALAAQTVLGAAKMVLQTKQHPSVLKDKVASPGGTTIAGLHELERGGLRAALMNAVEAATRRSAELGQRA